MTHVLVTDPNDQQIEPSVKEDEFLQFIVDHLIELIK